MPTESKTPNLSKQIEIYREILKTATDEYNTITVTRMNNQQALIKNYLWLAVTMLVSLGALFSFYCERATPGVCFGLLFFAAVTSFIAFFVGLRAMTGADFYSLTGDCDKVLKLCCPEQRFNESDTLQLLKFWISNADKGTDAAMKTISQRIQAMRWMNLLLSTTLLTLAGSAGLFFINQLSQGGL